jgi:hypothetical protein
MTIIINNIIVITIHIVISVICIFPIYFEGLTWGWGIFRYLAAVICIIIPFFLYYWAGNKFLRNTHNYLFNILSVITLAILLFTAVVFTSEQWFGYTLPFELLIGSITDLLQIPYRAVKEKYIYLTMSILPSLIMWIGLTTKRK